MTDTQETSDPLYDEDYLQRTIRRYLVKYLMPHRDEYTPKQFIKFIAKAEPKLVGPIESTVMGMHNPASI